MKVILAGFPKTGTKTLSFALKILGYDVYDYMEHFGYHGKEWNKILTTGGTVDDFKRMYQDVDAVIDSPAYFFWEQIHQAFPDALIILTSRDEQSWAKSWKNQLEMVNVDKTITLLWGLSPMGWSLRKYANHLHTALFGFRTPHAWSKLPVNNLMMINRYKMHTEYVMKSIVSVFLSQHAPKDELLLYDVRDGWEPLCKFLGKEVPDVPFPHKNAGGSLVDLLLKENAIMKKLMMHTIVAGAVWLSLGSVAMFFVGRSVIRKWNTGALASCTQFCTRV